MANKVATRGFSLTDRARPIQLARMLAGIGAVMLPATPVYAQVQPLGDNAAIESERPDYFDKPVTDDEFRLSMDEETARQVDTLIVQLADPAYKTRQEAHEALIQVGAAAMSRLRDAYHLADELETKLRIEQVTRSAYVNHHVLDKHGFLGISMLAYDPAPGGINKQRIATQANRAKALQPPLLPAGRVCVLVSQIIPDTGAFRAGVQRGDAIISMNGERVVGKGQAIQNAFSARIRKQKPGTTVELIVVRGSETLTFSPTLTRVPKASLGNLRTRVIVISALYNEASDRFLVWWEKFFLNSPAAPETSG